MTAIATRSGSPNRSPISAISAGGCVRSGELAFRGVLEEGRDQKVAALDTLAIARVRATAVRERTIRARARPALGIGDCGRSTMHSAPRAMSRQRRITRDTPARAPRGSRRLGRACTPNAPAARDRPARAPAPGSRARARRTRPPTSARRKPRDPARVHARRPPRHCRPRCRIGRTPPRAALPVVPATNTPCERGANISPSTYVHARVTLQGRIPPVCALLWPP